MSSTDQAAPQPPMPMPTRPERRSAPTILHKAKALQDRWPILQIVLLIAVFIYGTSTIEGFSTWPSIKLILVLAAIAGIASMGQTLLILMGGFDLSVAGFIVAGGLFTLSVRNEYDLSFGVALIIVLFVAALMGAAAGNICHRFNIQPLIVTLAMGTLAVGIVQVQTAGGSGYVEGGSAPPWLSKLVSPGSSTLGVSVPPVVAIWALLAVLFGFFLYKTRQGRQLLATGANPRAAEYSLIKTRRVWTLAFAFSACASVLVGLLVAGFSGSINLTAGDPYLFQSVVAVIVGGTVFGGPGDYWRTVVGALFLTVVSVVLVGNGATPAAQQIFYGVAILFGVSLYGRGRRLRDRV